VIPKRVKEEVDASKQFLRFEGALHLLRHHPGGERRGVRLVMETDRFTVLEPYAPRFHSRRGFCRSCTSRTSKIRTLPRFKTWPGFLRSTMRKIDKALERPAYNFIVHSAPVQDAPLPHYHWHLEIMPKLTKVAGFEWGTGSISIRRAGGIRAVSAEAGLGVAALGRDRKHCRFFRCPKTVAMLELSLILATTPAITAT